MTRILVKAYGGGSGYYPYTQKPVDYQPYRPVYLFRGPPPDAGFSYGLFEDGDSGERYYAELGLHPFSPLSGKSAKLLQELTHSEIERLLGDELKNVTNMECQHCGAVGVENIPAIKLEKQTWCHCCGGLLKAIKEVD